MTRSISKWRCSGPDLQASRRRQSSWRKKTANRAKKTPVTSCQSARPARANGPQNALPKPRPPRAAWRTTLLGTGVRLAAGRAAPGAGIRLSSGRRSSAGLDGRTPSVEVAFAACSRKTFAAKRVPIPSLRPRRTLSTQKSVAAESNFVALFWKETYGKKNASILARGG